MFVDTYSGAVRHGPNLQRYTRDMTLLTLNAADVSYINPVRVEGVNLVPAGEDINRQVMLGSGRAGCLRTIHSRKLCLGLP